jgi:hypothetical protein
MLSEHGKENDVEVLTWWWRESVKSEPSLEVRVQAFQLILFIRVNAYESHIPMPDRTIGSRPAS